MTNSIVMLAGPGRSTWIVADALQRRFGLKTIILEQRPGRWTQLRNRAKSLGWSTALGQAAFLPLSAILNRSSRTRITNILTDQNLSDGSMQNFDVYKVDSANSAQTADILSRLKPDIIIVNGTRILSAQLLNSTPAIFLNMHAGITPSYRGVHGGYWALVQGDRERCGVTVHVVDAGIDTGQVLYQTVIHPTSEDNFSTYPYLQLAAGVPLLTRAIESFSKELKIPNTITAHTREQSRLWRHPTLAQYVYNRLTRGVR